MTMKLLVSPISVEEARIALDGGADIIDVKNPKEGSLGANFPDVIQSVKRVITKPMSVAIGDFNYKPGTASLAALGASVAGADYIKIGLFDVQTREQASEMTERVTKAVKQYDSKKKVVICGYSDYNRINSISPFELPGIVSDAGADVVMMDTGVKDGRSTLEFLNLEKLESFIGSAHQYGLLAAIAGSLTFEDIEALKEVAPDIIGVRGCVCGGDRNSSIKLELVRELKERIHH
ncbi:MAG: (5-formylfuran-3-yl)methyl phosphate synthase [Candidatus Argoarchaeum ethanivorans]|uniref:(5-formylfuran-3-yl)methyl phosphate synthase n=1 Tax=Candidatus Argoarchaeum ethanivorans TaxID=2608793 RepID=A0A8B3S1U4_9EURY|nr:MAG: (5-formylfuran-3-yl)methyl phosphate synthase [Candidatus Argoarchaeum ethanivorans]